MPGANAVVGCRPVAAWGSHSAVAGLHNFDMRAPVAARSSVACIPGASEGCPGACQRAVAAAAAVGGGVVGSAPLETRRDLRRQRRSHHCRRVQERSGMPIIMS